MKVFATLPSGETRWLIDIRDWDFHWQDVYRFASPIALPAGTTVAMEYVYDNSVANRRNPSRPPHRVTYGQKTTDEMGEVWLQLARDAIAGKKRAIVTHSEIFPGTFASTTETADWLLRELGVPRRAMLEWGPMKTQILSEASDGAFRLVGFAGNSAPDHVDQLHSLPELLRWSDALASGK